MCKRQFATNLRIETILELKHMAVKNGCNVNDIIEGLFNYYELIQFYLELDDYESIKKLDINQLY